MKTLFSMIFILSIAMITSGCAIIPRKVWEPTVAKPFQYAEYLTGQGPIVGTPFMIGAIAGIPSSLATAPLTLLCERSEGEGSTAQDMGFFALGPFITGDIVATPFLLTKKTLWDFPRWLFVRKEEEKDTANEASEPSVAPAPQVQR